MNAQVHSPGNHRRRINGFGRLEVTVIDNSGSSAGGHARLGRGNSRAISQNLFGLSEFFSIAPEVGPWTA